MLRYHPWIEERSFWWQMCELFIESLKKQNLIETFETKLENLAHLGIYWRDGGSWLGSHWWLTAEVYARHYFSIENIFHPLNRQQNLLLVSQFHDSNILEILLVELRHITNRLKTFLLELCDVFVESKYPQPLFNRALEWKTSRLWRVKFSSALVLGKSSLDSNLNCFELFLAKNQDKKWGQESISGNISQSHPYSK